MRKLYGSLSTLISTYYQGNADISSFKSEYTGIIFEYSLFPIRSLFNAWRNLVHRTIFHKAELILQAEC